MSILIVAPHQPAIKLKSASNSTQHQRSINGAEMSQFYIDHAVYIRAVAYVGLAGYFIYWSASLASAGRRLQAVILLLVACFWTGSLHFTLSGNPLIQPFVFTPIVVLMALCCVVQVIVNKK